MEYSSLFQELNSKHVSIEHKALMDQAEENLKNEEALPGQLRRMSKKLSHAGYPFPLSGSDRAVEYEGVLHPAWWLTSSYTGKLHVFMLGDGTVVANNDYYSNVVEAFDIDRAKALDIADIRKTLIKYLKTKYVDLQVIPLENTSRQLQDLLPKLGWIHTK
jgi:hypothetical protein